MTDILAAIDAAIGCQKCGGPLGASPSNDFCSDWCQEAWHAARAEALTGYVEPYTRPWDFPGVGMSVYRPIPSRQLEQRAEVRVRIRPELAEPDVPMPVFTTHDSLLFLDEPPLPELNLDPTTPDLPVDAVAQVFAVGLDGEWMPLGHVPAGQHVTVRSSESGLRLSVGEEEFEPPPIPRPPVVNHVPMTIRLSQQSVDPEILRLLMYPHPPEFRLPRSTSDLAGDWAAAARARMFATTDAQRAAVQLRLDDLAERTRREIQPLYDRITDGYRSFAEHVGQMAADTFRAIGQALNSEWPPPERPAVDDPQQRALEARRNRNTGPSIRRRPPRRIDPRGVYR